MNTTTQTVPTPTILIDGNPAPLSELGESHGGGWTYSRDRESFLAALNCARGSYQHAVIAGHTSLSGSTLSGTARRFAGQYKRSVDALLARLEARGIRFEVCHIRGEIDGSRVNRNVLVIG